MAIIAARRSERTEGAPKFRRLRRNRVAPWVGMLSAVAGLSLATTLTLSGAAVASTTGSTGGLAGPDEVLQAMGFAPGLVTASGTPITYTNALYAYVKNDYIGVVVGYDGSYATPVDATNTVTHHSAGMIAIGNQKGSLLTGLDDLQALVGLGTFDGSGTTNPPVPLGYGSWPIPGYMEYGGGVIAVDYCAYTRALIDGTTTVAIVGGDPTKTLIEPRFENNLLAMRYQLLAGTGTTPAGGGNTGIGGLPAVLTPDLTLDQVIELYRATARIHWRLYNGDSTAHTVTLRFTLPVRDNHYSGVDPNDSFYYVDPLLGQSTAINTIPGASLPSVLTVYGSRYDDPNATNAAPFAAKTIFSGSGATTPTSVFVSDPFDVYAGNAGFYPTDIQNLRSQLQIGIAESLYFGSYSLAPGATQDIYTFYGNGRPTEDLKDDVVVGTEATESVFFNAAAAIDTKIAGNLSVVTDPTQLAYAESAYLSPNPINVEGSVYNRTLRVNQTPLSNVTMSLILPTGLQFAIPPGSSKVDTQTKTIGTVAGDTDQAAAWYIKADGTTFGPVDYQMVTASTQIGARSVTRTINIPAIPLHPVTNTSFQLLGFPFQFDQGATNNSDPATIINTLSPSSLRDTPAVFYYWVPNSDGLGGDNGHYAIAKSIVQGQGYFFRPAASRIINAYGASPVGGQTPLTNADAENSSPVQLAIQPGWNMITNPNDYSIPLSLLRIAASSDGTLNGASSTFLSAVNSGIILGSVYFFDTSTGAYDFFDFQSDQKTPTLDPWTGYWIYSTSKATVSFPQPTDHNSYIQPNSDGTTPSTRGVLARSAWAVAGPTMSNWTLQLTAQRSGRGDKAAIIGVAPSVTTKSATLPKPPAPASDYVYIGLVSPTAASNSTTRYAKVMQAASSSSKTWNFEVSSDKDGPVTLSWPNMATMPRLLTLKLKNLATNQTVSLSGRSSLSVNLKAGQKSTFEIVASQGYSTPLSINSAHVVSTGSTRAMGVSGSTVVFEMTRAADVTATIRSLNGRAVATLATSRAATVGENRLSWTGKSDSGAALPAGYYLLHLQARTEEGEAVESKTLFVVKR